MPAAALIIAADNLMPPLRDRVDAEGDVLTFSDTQPIEALQAILEQRPRLVVLERLFAATPRGAALINRIKSDPHLAASEVRVMSHTGDYTRQVVKPTAVAAPVAAVAGSASNSAASERAPEDGAPARPLDWHGTRRAPRYRVRSGVEIQLDGNPATVIDLSTVGAQVISATVLRPNQKVRVTVPNDDFMMRFRGAIAWAKFELQPSGAAGAQYRAGVEFTDADSAALDAFCERNRP
ncbi:MAG TPA: PilZ domain-containing protein [Vicinamibacterales bacterium]|nr:PilZ domain-containing protein [Vicinamibacterales bacterium]